MKMNPRTLLRKLGMPMVVLALASLSVSAEERPGSRESAASVDVPLTMALKAMKARAEELHIHGVALVAYAEGDSVASWSSKMVVVGSMTNAPSDKDKGANLLGIAYAKAAEMAATLKDSGNGGRPSMTGEYGWHGGVVAKGKTGILIAAFSGGRDEDDLSVSRTGLEILAGSL